MNEQFDLITMFALANGTALANIRDGPKVSNLRGNFTIISLGTELRLSPPQMNRFYFAAGINYEELTFYAEDSGYRGLPFTDQVWSGKLALGAQFVLGHGIVIDTGLSQGRTLSRNRGSSGLQLYLRVLIGG